MTEAVIAVTPSETIKYVVPKPVFNHDDSTTARTKLIDDAKRPVPQYRGLIHGTGQIIKAEGITGIYRGLFPVVCI